MAATLARSRTSPSSTSVSMSRTSHSSSIQSWRFTRLRSPAIRRRSFKSDAPCRGSIPEPGGVVPGVDVVLPRPRRRHVDAVADRPSAAHRQPCAPPREAAPGRAVRAPRELAAPVAVDEPRAVAPAARGLQQPGDGGGGDVRHVDGQRRPRSRRRRVRRRDAGAAARPGVRRRRGSSRVNVTGRRVGRLRPDHHDLARRRRPPRGRGRAGSGPPGSSAALSAPSIRDAVPPARTTAAQTTVGRCTAAASGGRLDLMQVRAGAGGVVAGPRRSTAAGWRALVPDGADLVVLPEAFARDFGEPGSDLAPHAEPLDGPFATEVARVAAERGTTVVAGMFEERRRRAAFNTLVVRGDGERRLPQDPPLRLLRLPGVRRAVRRCHRAAGCSSSAGSRVGLMTCYDLRFPELARRARRRGRRGAAWSRRPGSPARARSTTGDAAAGAGDREHRVRRGRAGSRARATPATRWWSARSATCWSRRGEGPAVLHAELDPAEVVAARRTNPSLANRRL